jgi:hypothetical protein
VLINAWHRGQVALEQDAVIQMQQDQQRRKPASITAYTEARQGEKAEHETQAAQAQNSVAGRKSSV